MSKQNKPLDQELFNIRMAEQCVLNRLILRELAGRLAVCDLLMVAGQVDPWAPQDYEKDAVRQHGENELGDPQLWRCPQGAKAKDIPGVSKSWVREGVDDAGVLIWSKPLSLFDGFPWDVEVNRGGKYYISNIDQNVTDPLKDKDGHWTLVKK